MKIEFTSMTRGFSKQIVATKDSLIATTSGRGAASQDRKVKMRSQDWDKVIAAMDGVMLSEIPDLKSPTEKRIFDGARHSTITITTTATTVSHSFDDEQPNEKLQKLLKELIKLEKSVKIDN